MCCSRIGENLELSLTDLRELVLTSNNIQELVSSKIRRLYTRDQLLWAVSLKIKRSFFLTGRFGSSGIGENIDPAQVCPALTINLRNVLLVNIRKSNLCFIPFSLLRNPVTNKKHYRLYVINKLPQIRVLDFQKVKLKVELNCDALSVLFSEAGYDGEWPKCLCAGCVWCVCGICFGISLRCFILNESHFFWKPIIQRLLTTNHFWMEYSTLVHDVAFCQRLLELSAVSP